MNTIPHLAASDRFANSKRGLTHQTHPDGLKHADRLAAAVLELIAAGTLDMRSNAGDALLKYCRVRMESSGTEEINEFIQYAEATGLMKARE